jgi:hypothetical protein
MPCNDKPIAAVIACPAKDRNLRIFDPCQFFLYQLSKLLPAFSINTTPGIFRVFIA